MLKNFEVINFHNLTSIIRNHQDLFDHHHFIIEVQKVNCECSSSYSNMIGTPISFDYAEGLQSQQFLDFTTTTSTISID